MKVYSSRLLLILAALFFTLAGCDDDTSSSDGGPGQDGDGYVAGDDGGDPGSDPGDESPNDAADEGGEDAGDQTVEPVTASFPQALAGALFANPESFRTIPLRVATSGEPESVTVNLDGDDVEAEDPDGDGVFVAPLMIGQTANGSYTVTATVEKTGTDPAVATVELVIATEGAQLTDWWEVGPAGTPRIHRRGEDVYLTWTDTPEDIRTLWMQRIDGAGRWIGEKVALLADVADTVHARTVFGNDSIGIIYHQPDGPYDIYFTIVDFDGNQLLAPMYLVPQDLYGSFGGDIVFDGTSFVMAWRVNAGDGGGGEIRWMRVEETGHAVVGPVVVAASGDGDPVGGFDPFMFTKLIAIGDASLVTFVRKQHNYFLDEDLPKSQVSLVMNDGTVAWTEMLDQPADMFEEWRFHRECRPFVIGGRNIIIWSRRDLNDEDPNAPMLFFATDTDADGNLRPDRAMGILMEDVPEAREEFTLVPHPDHYATMAWLDTRSYVDLENGRAELLVAPMQPDLTLQEVVNFPHSRHMMGACQPSALPQDTNVLLVWLDERHGNGPFDPKPEMWFETAWY